PVRSRCPTPPLGVVIQANTCTGCVERKRTRNKYAVRRFRCTRRKLLFKFVPVRLAFCDSHVTGSINKFFVCPVCYFGYIHPESVYPDVMRGTFMPIGVSFIRAHDKLTSAYPNHSCGSITGRNAFSLMCIPFSPRLRSTRQ